MNSFVEAGQLLSERYRLTSLFPEQLPYSGISVWSAIDTLLGTSLRLIILDPGAPNTTEALDSARRSSLIDDPHVVRILSVGQDASACYIATEVPLGTPLSHFLHGTPFSPEQAHALSGEIASALNSARSRGVRHLQLTSQQVRVGVLGEVFIDGLGVDAALAGMHTDSMETAQADRIEARGLSLLLACLLTGQPGGKPEALLRGVADNDRLPEQLRNVCARELKGVGALSPSDFVRELAPWGVISPGAFPQPVGGAPAPPSSQGAASGPAGAAPSTGPAPQRPPAHDPSAGGAFPANAPTPPGMPGAAEPWAQPPAPAWNPAGAATGHRRPMVDPLSEHAIAPSGMNPAWVGLDQFAEEHPEAIDPSATAIFTPEDFESASHHYSDPRLDVDAPGQADAPEYEASGRTPPSGQASTGPQGRPESALTPAEPDSEQRAEADTASAPSASSGGTEKGRSAENGTSEPGGGPALVVPAAEPSEAAAETGEASTRETPADNGAEGRDGAADAPGASAADDAAPAASTSPTPDPAEAGASQPADDAASPAAGSDPTASETVALPSAASGGRPQDEQAARSAGGPMPESILPARASGSASPNAENAAAGTTPPNAIPPSITPPNAVPPGAVPPTGPQVAARRPGPAGGNPPPPPTPGAPSAGRARPVNAEAKKLYDPSKVAVMGAAILVVVGAIWSLLTFCAPTNVPPAKPAAGAPTTKVVPEKDKKESKPTATKKGKESSKKEDENLPSPQVESATLLNPQAADFDPSNTRSQDSPQTVKNVVDGNAATIWRSWWYSNPNFVRKQGVGLEIKLKEKAKVSSVDIQSGAVGGNVQWRNTSAAAPNAGDVIAESSMSTSMTLESGKPIATDTVILWFNQLPKNKARQNRIEISEITVK